MKGGSYDLASSISQKFGGIYNFVKVLRNIVDSNSFSRCAVIWDGERSRRRLNLFPQYKQRIIDPNRVVETREGSIPFSHSFGFQRQYLDLILPKLGVESITIRNREADDIIWWARDIGNKIGIAPCYVFSEDRDFCQMVDENTTLVFRDNGCDRHINVDNFESEIGMSKERFLLFKSLNGDKSDMIPGAYGVGKVTALQIARNVEDPTDWESLYDYCTQSLSKRVRAVCAQMSIVKRNYELMCLSLETLDEFELEQLEGCLRKSPDKDFDFIMDKFCTMEFRKLSGNFHMWSMPFSRIGTRGDL